MIVVHLSRHLEHNLIRAMGWGSFLAGGLVFIYAWNRHPGVALGLCLLMGLPYQLRETARRTLLQKVWMRRCCRMYWRHMAVSSTRRLDCPCWA